MEDYKTLVGTVNVEPQLLQNVYPNGQPYPYAGTVNVAKNAEGKPSVHHPTEQKTVVK